MKLNESYINNIITETTNRYLAEKLNFNWKNRVKNGLKGFDVGSGYQKTVGRYSNNNYGDIIGRLTQAVKVLTNYVTYLNSYKGKNKTLITLRECVVNYKTKVAEILNLYQVNDSNYNNQVTEGIGNRLGGFARGFASNKDYSQDVSDNTQNMISSISSNYETLRNLDGDIQRKIKDLISIFKENKRFVDKITKIGNGINYITKYVYKVSFKQAEQHSKWTDRGYKFGQEASKVPGKIKDKAYQGLQKISNYGEDNYEDDEIKIVKNKEFPNIPYQDPKTLGSQPEGYKLDLDYDLGARYIPNDTENVPVGDMRINLKPSVIDPYVDKAKNYLRNKLGNKIMGKINNYANE